MTVLDRKAKYLQSGVFDSDGFTSRARPIVDSTGAFLAGELELIDPTLHLPLRKITFAEDLQPRQGLTVTDEWASWTNSYDFSNGSLSVTGKPWVGQTSQDAPTVSTNIIKQGNQLGAIKLVASWTQLELMKSQRLQRPIDVDRLVALENQWGDILDNQAYLGESAKNLYGIANATTSDGNTNGWAVTQIASAVTGSWASNYASSPTTAAQLILNDLRALDNAVYNNSGWTSPATKFLIPAAVWSIVNVPLAIAGVPVAISIREYFEKFAAIAASEGKTVTLVPRKWLSSSIPGNSYGNTLSSNRVVAYSPDYENVRFEYSPLVNTGVTVFGDEQRITYFGAVGGIEIVRPSTIGVITGV